MDSGTQGATRDYLHPGRVMLFAALDVATGAVLAQAKERRRNQEFLQFLRYIDANVPQEVDVHIITDKYATYKHEKVRSWFATRP